MAIEEEEKQQLLKFTQEWYISKSHWNRMYFTFKEEKRTQDEIESYREMKKKETGNFICNIYSKKKNNNNKLF